MIDTAEWKGRALWAQGPECDSGDVWLKWCGGGDFFFLTVSLAISRYLQLNILWLERGIGGDSKNRGKLFKIVSNPFFFFFFLA